MKDLDRHRKVRLDSPVGWEPLRPHSPSSLWFESSGTLLAAFYDDNTIYRIHPDGSVDHVLGIFPDHPYPHDPPRQSFTVSEAASVPLQCPVGVVAKSDGTIFFIERQSHVVREFHPKRGLRSIFEISLMWEWFQKCEAPARGRLDSYYPVSPLSLALDKDETLYLCDNLHGAVLRLSLESGTFERVVHSPRSSSESMRGGPLALAFGPDGTAWIAQSDGPCIQSYTMTPGEWTRGPLKLEKVDGQSLDLIEGGMGLMIGD